MKRRKRFYLSAMVISVSLLLAVLSNSFIHFEQTEVLTACEVKDGGKIIFECEGTDGECSASFLGNSITCSGKQK